MKLRSIPPANRTPRRVVSGRVLAMNGAPSSMRAATASTHPNAPVVPYRIAPDLDFQRQREVSREALRALARQLEELIAAATEEDEILFWQAALERLKTGR